MASTSKTTMACVLDSAWHWRAPLKPSLHPLATGLTNSGSAEGQVIDAVRSGEILSIKIRFKPVVMGKTETIYSADQQKRLREQLLRDRRQ